MVEAGEAAAGQMGQGDQRVGARGALHGDRDDVVDEQGDRRDLRDARPEVLARDDVRAARAGVDGDDVAVGEREQEEDQQDRAGDRQQQGEGGDADDRDQDAQHLLRPVRGGGYAVGGEHAERQRVGQFLPGELLVDQRRSEEAALYAVGETVADGEFGVGGHAPMTAGAGARRRETPRTGTRESPYGSVRPVRISRQPTTVHVSLPARREARSPLPFRTTAASSWSDIWVS